ncbi:MAG: glycosyltransferase family 2 protein [Aequorivita sp.]
MISILIPTYNYDVLPLVENLHQQCKNSDVTFEIIVVDDASTDKKSLEENSKINLLEDCEFEILKENIGRSKIRNLLAKKAKYEWLLFLDADTFPSTHEFINHYLNAFSQGSPVIYGGVKYPINNSKKFSLRHHYGSVRETLPLAKRLENPYKSFISMGFAIKKSVFETIQFNENLSGYGYEDSIFASELQQNNISILHIDNPVLHLNLETNEDFIRKSQIALQNLLNFYSNGEIDGETVKILQTYLKLKKLNLLFGVRWLFKLFEKSLLKNLNSTNPSLVQFDLYRLGYLSSLNRSDA